MTTKKEYNNESRFAGTNWDAEVKCTSDGPGRSVLRRKVLTKGTKTIKCPKVINDAIRLLRMGFEVRLGNEQGDAIRLYPCMGKDFDTMFAAAMTTGDFRNCLNDKKAKVIRRFGKAVTVDEAVEEGKKKYEASKAHQAVTPDTMVKCPKCGCEFRVGKVLSAVK